MTDPTDPIRSLIARHRVLRERIAARLEFVDSSTETDDDELIRDLDGLLQDLEAATTSYVTLPREDYERLRRVAGESADG